MEAITHMAPDIRVLVEYENSDSEAWSYSLELLRMFVEIDAEVTGHSANSHLGGIVFGVHISGSPEFNVGFVASEFAKAHIPMQVNTSSYVDLSMRFAPSELPNLYIFVGPKPPPAFAERVLLNAESSIEPQSVNAMRAATDERAAALERAATPRRISPEQHSKIVAELREKLPLTPEQRAHGKIRRNEDEAVILEVVIEAADEMEAILFANQLNIFSKT